MDQSSPINLSSLPIESIYNILINTPFNDVIKYCTLNSTAAAICDDKYFWHQKAFNDFGISLAEFDNTTLKPKIRYIQLYANKYNICNVGYENFISVNVCLKRAAINNNENLVTYFIEKNGNKTAAFKGVGITGNLELFKKLIEIYPSMKYVYVTLFNAIKNEHLDLIKYIMEKWRKYIDLYDNETFYKIALEINGSLEIVRYFFPDVDPYDINQEIYSASKGNHIDTINYFLIKVQGNVATNTKAYESAIAGAGAGGHIDLMNQLISHNIAVPNILALNDIAEGGHLEIIKDLLMRYPTFNNIDNMNHILKNGSIGGYLNIIKYAVENGANDFNRSLELASEHGHLDIVKYLIEEKRANSLNDSLTLSAKNGYLDIVKYLVEKGADNLNEALYFSSDDRKINIEIVKFLIEKGADDIEQFSRLVTYRSGDFNTIKYLADHQLTNLNNLLLLLIRSPIGHFGEKIKSISYLISKGANNFYDCLQEAIDDCELLVVEYLISIGISFYNVSLGIPKIFENIEEIEEKSISECNAIVKYLKYLIANQDVKILNFQNFSDKINKNEIISFETFKPIINVDQYNFIKYLVPLQMVLSIDTDGNKYITVLRYNKETNQIYPTYF